jgi:ketosteroid isomerase-like protein
MLASHSRRVLIAASAVVIAVLTNGSIVARAYTSPTLAAFAAALPQRGVIRALGRPCGAHEPDATEIALGSLVDAELAFARMSLEQGIRAAFLANFAADGVVFEPAPVRLREAWAQRASPADPKAIQLEWQPAQAGVARSGDMGFTTGPWKLTDARRPGDVRHGVFFSVWQRDKAGVWRVGIDVGITTPQAVDFVPLGAAPRPAYVGKASASEQRKSLLAHEARAFNTARAYDRLLAADARLHRNGMSPVAGRKMVTHHVTARAPQIEWLPFDARIAHSADMAVTYGKFQSSGGNDGAKEGYYVHLWLRDAAGRWRLAYDIAPT